MRVPTNLPPLNAENEDLYYYINYLQMLLRLTLCGIVSGEFDGDHRQECVDAIRNQV